MSIPDGLNVGRGPAASTRWHKRRAAVSVAGARVTVGPRTQQLPRSGQGNGQVQDHSYQVRLLTRFRGANGVATYEPLGLRACACGHSDANAISRRRTCLSELAP